MDNLEIRKDELNRLGADYTEAWLKGDHFASGVLEKALITLTRQINSYDPAKGIEQFHVEEDGFTAATIAYGQIAERVPSHA